MRILHVITRLIVGGAQENTLASVLGLRRWSGWEVGLISGPSQGPEGSLEAVAQTVPGLLTLVPELVRPIHPWKDLLAWRRLVSLFRAQAPVLVHTHSGKAGILGRWAAHRARVPLVVHTIHGPSFGLFQGPLSNLSFRWAERLAGRVTDHFVAVAQAMIRQYLAAGIGQPDQYTRILSGFDLAPYQAAQNDPTYRARWRLAREHLVIGTIARLFKLKGHDDLLEAAARVVRRQPQARFLMVGDGPWRQRLAVKADSLGLSDHVVFTGLVPPDEIPRLVGIMDIVVHLSRREGLARALPQALAAARPIVAYDCDGAGEVCLPDQTGYLVQPGNLAELENRLHQLGQNPDLRSRLGQQGQEFVRSLFPVEKMIADLAQLYQTLLESKGLSLPRGDAHAV
jgi:glycosyltransferase involved in cell wall biosynthesis